MDGAARYTQLSLLITSIVVVGWGSLLMNCICKHLIIYTKINYKLYIHINIFTNCTQNTHSFFAREIIKGKDSANRKLGTVGSGDVEHFPSSE